MPIPQPLMRMLREYVEEFGMAKDGRLFSSERGNVMAFSSYCQVWRQAEELGLVPAQVSLVPAGRPYELRDPCVTRGRTRASRLRKWLNGQDTRRACSRSTSSASTS